MGMTLCELSFRDKGTSERNRQGMANCGAKASLKVSITIVAHHPSVQFSASDQHVVQPCRGRKANGPR